MILAGCATPIAPTGGQPVRSSPTVISTYPEQGRTRFDGREVRFEFNRFMNRGSATRALRVEPDFGIPFTISWKRKVLILTFERSLPDSVTVIVSLGTELSDIENNRLGQPIQLAFSTGAAVDSAKVDIATLSFDKARGESGMTVGLFRESMLDQSAVYVAESDTSGIVRFRHATPGQYVAVLFDDRNRNRRIDQGERHFPAKEPVTVSTDSAQIVGPLFYTSQDTVPPTVLGVGLLSNTRIRVRFSEPIRLNRSSSVEVQQDSRIVQALWLYSDTADPTVAFANSMEPLLQGASYNLRVTGVTDLAGNSLAATPPTFVGSNQQDTTQVRLVRFPENPVVLSPDSILFVYSKPLSGSAVIDSLIVVDGERAMRTWTDVHVEHNRMYVYREGGWRPGQSYQIRVWDPLQLRHVPISFRPLGEADLGGLEITIEPSWSDGVVVVDVLDQAGEILNQAKGVGPFIFDDLIPGNVSIRVWVDTNGNGRWDGGSIIPATADPEPVYIQRGIPISPRLTTAVRVGSND